MSARTWSLVLVVFMSALFAACGSPNPQVSTLTPIPTLAPAAQVTLVPALQGGASTSPTSQAPGTPGTTSAALGAGIYPLHCSSCHGARCEGVDAPPLRNSSYVQSAGEQTLFSAIADGIQGTEMPAWLQNNGGPLTAQEIADVIAYVGKLQGVSPLPAATPAPAEPTETPPPAGAPTPAPALPSEAGGPGPAVGTAGDIGRGRPAFGQFCADCHGAQGVQGIPNPGTEDGVVPALNPIDPTLLSADAKTFATNIDLFVEHGSTPGGSAPMITMPAFGDRGMLTAQQIADLIAYTMYLNGVQAR